jgi:cytochrome b pre-mRNA-processing protein 3
MLQWLKRRTETGRRASELYGSVVAAARRPFFYEGIGVPDTPNGRFELIALHLFLVLESIKDRGQAERDLTQRTIERFVTDMDDCMREMGVGDIAVPKKVKRAAAVFCERVATYRGRLAEITSEGLEASLRNDVFAGAPCDKIRVAALARYVRGAASALRGQPIAAFIASGEQDRLLGGSSSEVS